MPTVNRGPLIVNEDAKKRVTVLERHVRTFLRDVNGKVAYARRVQRKIVVLEDEDGELYETYSDLIYKRFQVKDEFTAYIRYYSVNGETVPYVVGYEAEEGPKTKKKAKKAKKKAR